MISYTPTSPHPHFHSLKPYPFSPSRFIRNPPPLPTSKKAPNFPSMASSKLYHHFSSSLLLINRRTPLTLKPFPPSLFLKPSFTPLSLRFCSSTATADVDVVSASSSSSSLLSSTHPWPEWGQFIDKMRSKGYFAAVEDVAAADEKVPSFTPSDLNKIKNACLKFARERFDIFRSLPKEDIQAVVEIGCPNVYRKAVNSAKRLRAFLRLNERGVCSACKLQGECDKANVEFKEDDQARTVDIVRILMTYAVDPALCSGGTNPSITEHAQESARNLLVELIRLSDTTIDPALLKPAVQASVKKESSRRDTNYLDKSKNVEMKKGDWVCSKCNFTNFARNVRCLKCKADGPKTVEFSNKEMKPGDWTCSNCEFMNFARNKQCFRCRQARPKRQLQNGEWECPKCDFLNFRGNTACKKCNCGCPDSGGGSTYDDYLWKKPRTGKEEKFLKFGDDDEDDKDKEEDIDDEELDSLLPRYGENKFIVSKRATPAEQRFTSARNRDNSL